METRGSPFSPSLVQGNRSSEGVDYSSPTFPLFPLFPPPPFPSSRRRVLPARCEGSMTERDRQVSKTFFFLPFFFFPSPPKPGNQRRGLLQCNSSGGTVASFLPLPSLFTMFTSLMRRMGDNDALFSSPPPLRARYAGIVEISAASTFFPPLFPSPPSRPCEAANFRLPAPMT